jgi:hypothetical protein
MPARTDAGRSTVTTMTAESRLAVVAVGQQGAFTRAQALEAGFSAAQIERRVRAEVWVRVFPRVYHHASTPRSSALAHWAAVLWCGQPCALSHTSAAALWRIRTGSVERPELTVPKARAPRVDGVVVHRTQRIDGDDVASVGGLPVTSPVRTVIDLAGALTERDLEVLIHRARARRVVTVRALRTRLDEIGTLGRPGAARLGRLLATIGSGRVEPSARMAG